jgi:hypothetical protein
MNHSSNTLNILKALALNALYFDCSEINFIEPKEYFRIKDKQALGITIDVISTLYNQKYIEFKFKYEDYTLSENNLSLLKIIRKLRIQYWFSRPFCIAIRFLLSKFGIYLFSKNPAEFNVYIETPKGEFVLDYVRKNGLYSRGSLPDEVNYAHYHSLLKNELLEFYGVDFIFEKISSDDKEIINRAIAVLDFLKKSKYSKDWI